jgi:hypothetical protein
MVFLLLEKNLSLFDRPCLYKNATQEEASQ